MSCDFTSPANWLKDRYLVSTVPNLKGLKNQAWMTLSTKTLPQGEFESIKTGKKELRALLKCCKLKVVSITKRSHLVNLKDVWRSRKSHLMALEVYNKERLRWERGRAGHRVPSVPLFSSELYSARHRECSLSEVVFSKQLDISIPDGWFSKIDMWYICFSPTPCPQ